MKRMATTLAALAVAGTLWAGGIPNFAEARWETVRVNVFGPDGLKVDKLTGEAWYRERVNQQSRWVNVPGPLTAAALKSLSFNKNFQVKPAGENVFLIDLNGGASWRLADSNGRPCWRRIE